MSKILKVPFILLINYFLSSYYIQSQIKSDLKFDEIYNKALNDIDLKKLDLAFSDSTNYEDFDFKEFEPICINKKNKIHYKAFFKNDQIVKLSRIERANPFIYEFYFWDYEKYKIYIAITHYKEKGKPADFGNIQGFFIYEKESKSNLFIGIDGICNDRIFNEKEQCFKQIKFTKDSVSKTKDVRTIILLDKSLYPEKRLNFYNNHFISYSTFFLSKNNSFESIWIYDNSEVDFDLQKHTFYELYNLFTDPPERKHVALDVYISLNQYYAKIPWADHYNKWGYSYFPF